MIQQSEIHKLRVLDHIFLQFGTNSLVQRFNLKFIGSGVYSLGTCGDLELWYQIFSKIFFIVHKGVVKFSLSSNLPTMEKSVMSSKALVFRPDYVIKVRTDANVMEKIGDIGTEEEYFSELLQKDLPPDYMTFLAVREFLVGFVRDNPKCCTSFMYDMLDIEPIIVLNSDVKDKILQFLENDGKERYQENESYAEHFSKIFR